MKVRVYRTDNDSGVTFSLDLLYRVLHYFAPANDRPTACQHSNMRVLERVEYECSGARVLVCKSSSICPSTREYESRDSTLAFKLRVSRTVALTSITITATDEEDDVWRPVLLYECKPIVDSCCGGVSPGHLLELFVQGYYCFRSHKMEPVLHCITAWHYFKLSYVRQSLKLEWTKTFIYNQHTQADNAGFCLRRSGMVASDHCLENPTNRGPRPPLCVSMCASACTCTRVLNITLT